MYKGQLILKGNFSVFNTPKNELGNGTFCPSLMGQEFFVPFWENRKNQKTLSKLTEL